MTLKEARSIIVRKFTNYRNKLERNSKGNATNEDVIEAMKVAASAIIDYRSYGKGRQLFRRKKHVEILALRDTLMKDDSSLPQIAAYQKAHKQLWEKEEQDSWNEKALGEPEDIFECVFHFLYLYIK